MSSPTIEHQPERQQFSCELDGHRAVLSYQLLPGQDGQRDMVNFTHTYTPPSFRGRGISTALVQAGLTWAREQQFDVRATCWFVQKFL